MRSFTYISEFYRKNSACCGSSWMAWGRFPSAILAFKLEIKWNIDKLIDINKSLIGVMVLIDEILNCTSKKTSVG